MLLLNYYVDDSFTISIDKKLTTISINMQKTAWFHIEINNK